MSTVKVLRLDEYRDRRMDRLRLAESLYGADSGRHALLLHLSEVSRLAGADRTAVVWVDEYGSGLIHPHVVLDLLSDRPRRSFSAEPLHRAWELGVPGAYDSGADPVTTITPTFAIALGSDGTRAWFLVAESVGPRAPLDAEARDTLMFVAGECSAVVLHRDLDLVGEEHSGMPAAQARSGFAGWRVLQDIEGRESDDAESRRIALRFMVVRLARLLVDDDLSMSEDRIEEQVRLTRAQILADAQLAEDERPRWEAVLDALLEGRIEDLAAALVDLGEVVEARSHHHGALELYECAYEIAASTGAAASAVDAARFRGRLLRRRASWAESERWYGVARQVAEAAGMHNKLALVLVGLAVIKKEIGNLPAAREGLENALSVAERSGDRDAIAGVHLDLLGLEHAAGDLATGLKHGWVAVATYESQQGRVRSLASLAGALAAYGDYEAAEDAWALVASQSSENYYRIYAFDALAYLSALKGDAASFETYTSRCDELGWESGPRSAMAEVLYYRGLSHRALGDYAAAEKWLARAVSFAEEHSFNRILFQAEDALASLEAVAAEDAAREPTPAAPLELKEGLRAMRRELAGAAV